MSHNYDINETHDPNVRAFCGTHPEFPLQNLPFGVFRPGENEAPRGGVALGEYVIDLARLADSGELSDIAQAAANSCRDDTLNAFLSLGQASWSALRLSLSRLFRDNSSIADKLRDCLHARAKVQMCMPCRVGDFTDFYSSKHHATAVGQLFRPDNPLLPNYRWVPVAYHGRSSSLAVSPQRVTRPNGQLKSPNAATPSVGASQRLDYELELGLIVGPGNDLGQAVPVAEAESHIFGICLLNDWSARDVQAWEYQPLGPFLAKNFATTLSPWIVSLEALAPFRAPWQRIESDTSGDFEPLPYLDAPAIRASGAIRSL